MDRHMRESLDRWLTTPPEDSPPLISEVEAGFNAWWEEQSETQARFLTGQEILAIDELETLLLAAYSAGWEVGSETAYDERALDEAAEQPECSVDHAHDATACNGVHYGPSDT